MTNTIKRFISNKNTVTIIGVVLVLLLLYWGYSQQVSTAVKPVTVPVASQIIQPRTQITADMISNIEISQIAVLDNVYTNSNQVIGMYSNVNTQIPKNSMFYKESLVEKENLPDSAFFELSIDEIPYLFSVTLESTYGNAIYPGSKVDIYMKAVDEDNKVMVGKLLADVKVLAVKDGSGNDVFENSENESTPAYLVFGLPDEIHILLRKAEYLTTNSVVLFPVPHGGTVPSDGEIRVSTEYLKNFINDKTIVLEGQEGSITEEDEDDEEEE